MAGRFEDDEIDLLSSFPSVSSTPVTSNSTPSDPFSIYSDPVHGHSPRIFDRFESSSSSDDEFSLSASTPNCANHNGVAKKLDYMIQYLDRKLSKDNGNGDGSRPLPEFVGKGGGTGIFRLPCRAVVRPDRPPSVEVRPHPLRETQIGCSLRVILCTETQLWAGGESGVRYWNLSELYSVRAAGARGSGDEMAAPFVELGDVVAEVVCMVADEGNGVVWSGHRDGKIRCWRMDQRLGGNGFKECLSWQAHRWPVLSMVMTSYGDLWSGTENGAIKIWPWEAIEKSLSLPAEERHMAVLTVERSYIDLRSQVTINGVCYMFASDVKYLLSDHSTAKVWSAGIYSFALWNSRTRELLKVFNTDGQIENWVDFSSIQDLTAEDEVKMQFVAALRKEKPQAVSGFLQRSRNAILGAADAVRRAAVKGACGDDNQRTEAMVITVDGVTWTGCSGGLLVQWDGNGNRLQEFQYHPFAVQCLCTYGSRIWVGYVSGTVLVLDLDGKWLGEWIAHSAPVVKMAVGAGYVFSLAGHGGIRGWSITSPGPVDSPLSLELTGKEFIYSRIENLKILAGTWNVGEGRASSDSLVSWLGGAASDVDIVVVGLQELEMGAGVLAMSAAKESVGMDSSAVGQWWLDMIGNILDEGSSFERIGSRQLAGLLIGVWVRNNDLRANVGDIDIAAVPCGFGRAIGNKGAVGLRMRVYDRVMCFVNCHFAAHLEAVNRRNADFDHVYRSMVFSRPSHVFNTAAAGISSAVQMLRGTNAVGVRSVEVVPELSEADLVIFLGDFNYRIDGISYDEVRDFISQRCFDWLRERDQLRAEMEAGNVFQGMREAIIRFPPTYKFEKHQPGLAGYDAGEKKRIPAWCDRILYRDSRSSALAECSLDCPVVCSISQYEACMDVTDSDHKPVRCILNVDIARVDESVRRQEFGEIMESNEKIRHVLQDLCRVPETVVSTNNIILQNDDTTILRITNRSGVDKAFYMIICEGQSTVKEDGLADNHCPRGSFGLPRWLEVNPAKGVIDPDRTVEISLHHEDFQTLVEFVDGVPRNCWCEDARDKEVILVVKIHGSCSTEVGYHRVRVRHCLSSKTKGIVIRPSAEPEPKKGQGNVLQRSNFQHLNSSLDVFDQLLNLHTP